ncbi:MAG: GNAT family N-acetyltransferase [Bacteroidia bacterium]|nr:GNAT family N-acetyltransferase [Bacteroidia bacterium]
MSVQLIPLNRFNWEEVISLQPAPGQEEFLPSNLFSIAQSKFDPGCTPLAIQKNDRTVGFAMYCNWNGVCWINRIMVDQESQQQGVGSKALELLVELLTRKKDCAEIRASMAVNNIWAQYLFSNAGFEATGADDHEIIMTLKPRK